MTYKAPKVSVDMQGKQNKITMTEFKVDDAVPESWSGYEGELYLIFMAETVNNFR